MAARKPAVSTLLKKAQEDVARLTKEVESITSNRKYYQEAHTKATNEVEELHAFFDALPNSIPRKDDNGYNQRSAMTRMAAWLATK